MNWLPVIAWSIGGLLALPVIFIAVLFYFADRAAHKASQETKPRNPHDHEEQSH